MAQYFWVAGSGNWNDSANHWSSSSGGSPGAGVPTSADDCIFDANSFSSISRILTFNVAPSVKSMDFSTVDANVIVSVNNGPTIAGDLTLKSGMTWTTTGNSTTFNTTGTTCNLTTGGIDFEGQVILAGTGTFNMMDDLTITTASSKFYINSDLTFNTNNFDLTCATLQIVTPGSPTINWGSSTITLNGATNTLLVTGTPTFNWGTSTMHLTASGADFLGGGKTYGDVYIENNTTMTGINTFS